MEGWGWEKNEIMKEGKTGEKSLVGESSIATQNSGTHRSKREYSTSRTNGTF